MGANSPINIQEKPSQQIIDWIPGISLSASGKVYVQWNGGNESIVIPYDSSVEEVACAFLSIMGVQPDEYVNTKCSLSIWTKQGSKLVGALPPNQPDTAYTLKLAQGMYIIAYLQNSSFLLTL